MQVSLTKLSGAWVTFHQAELYWMTFNLSAGLYMLNIT